MHVVTTADAAAITKVEGTAYVAKVGDTLPSLVVGADEWMVLPDGKVCKVAPVTTPPAFAWQPIPTGWKLLQRIDLRSATATPATLWNYAGQPGGTSGCLWRSDADTLQWTAEGAVYRTHFDTATNMWISAGLGTQMKVAAPLRARVYERMVDNNIGGLNKINLLWASAWTDTEVDFDECAASGGKLSCSIARIHDGSSGDCTSPITQPVAQDFAPHCYEVELVNNRMTIYVDGVAAMPGVPIPAAEWTDLTTKPHWIGAQSQGYSLPSMPADHTLVSKRVISGFEFLVPA